MIPFRIRRSFRNRRQTFSGFEKNLSQDSEKILPSSQSLVEIISKILRESFLGFGDNPFQNAENIFLWIQRFFSMELERMLLYTKRILHRIRIDFSGLRENPQQDSERDLLMVREESFSGNSSQDSEITPQDLGQSLLFSGFREISFQDSEKILLRIRR